MKASIFLLFQTFLLVIGVVGVMVAAIPWIGIPAIPLGILLVILQAIFLRDVTRCEKRLECTSEYLGSQFGTGVHAGFYLYCN